MATHTAVRRSKHATLVANTVDTAPLQPSAVTTPTASEWRASLGTINCNQAADLRIQTLTCALGTHTINVARATGMAYLFGIRCRNSTVSRVYVEQCAHASGTAGTFATSFTNFNYTNIAAD